MISQFSAMDALRNQGAGMGLGLPIAVDSARGRWCANRAQVAQPQVAFTYYGRETSSPRKFIRGRRSKKPYAAGQTLRNITKYLQMSGLSSVIERDEPYEHFEFGKKDKSLDVELK